MYMDIPGSFNFESTCRLVQNRKVWKQMSCCPDDKHRMYRYARLFLATRILSQQSPRTRRRTRRNPMTPPPITITTATPIPTTTPSPSCSAHRYRTRDVYALFFLPRSKTTVKNRKFKKTTRKLWTNKQRTVWSRAHFIIHHDSATEATRFVSTELVTAVSPEVFNQIFQMSTNTQAPTAPTSTSPPEKPTQSTTTTPSRSPPRLGLHILIRILYFN